MEEFDFGNCSGCPRCGSHSFEHLETYAHCPNCLYCEDLELRSRPTTLAEIDRQIENLEAEEFEPSEDDSEFEFQKAAGW